MALQAPAGSQNPSILAPRARAAGGTPLVTGEQVSALLADLHVGPAAGGWNGALAEAAGSVVQAPPRNSNQGHQLGEWYARQRFNVAQQLLENLVSPRPSLSHFSTAGDLDVVAVGQAAEAMLVDRGHSLFAKLSGTGLLKEEQFNTRVENLMGKHRQPGFGAPLVSGVAAERDFESSVRGAYLLNHMKAALQGLLKNAPAELPALKKEELVAGLERKVNSHAARALRAARDESSLMQVNQFLVSLGVDTAAVLPVVRADLSPPQAQAMFSTPR